MQHAELSERVIGCAYAVFNTLGAGFLESVYENALLLELRAAGLEAEPQVKLVVYYRGQAVGYFFADIIVNNLIIVELKAAASLDQAHEVQLVNYHTATQKDVGLLINFGPAGVTIRRKVRDLATLPSPRPT